MNIETKDLKVSALKMFYSTIIFTLVALPQIFAIDYTSVECNLIATNANALMSQVQCRPHETVIDIQTPMVANNTAIIRVMPDMVLVKRCSGSCSSHSNKCIAVGIKRTKLVPVMITYNIFEEGQRRTVCSEVEVEEHDQCACGCPLVASDCQYTIAGDRTSKIVESKYFDRESCKCTCANLWQKEVCYLNRKEWIDETCSCRCPRSVSSACSTGWVFDWEDTCRCVPVGRNASLGLIAALVIVCICLIVSGVGIFIMRRQNTGIFRRHRWENIIQSREPLWKANKLGKDLSNSEAVLSTEKDALEANI